VPRSRLAKHGATRGELFGFGLSFLLLASCRQEGAPPPSATPSVTAAVSAAPARVTRPKPTGKFGCESLRPPPDPSAPPVPEIIELGEIAPGKKTVMAKTGVIVTFNRDDMIAAARCLKFDKALRYLEEETGTTPESPIMDAFQLSYVAAAMLDAGHANVRREEEDSLRTTIVRDAWAAEGCRGHCRSSGRLYRLTENDPSFFLRITDDTRKL